MSAVRVVDVAPPRRGTGSLAASRMKTRWSLSGCRVAGGAASFEGVSPFAQADLILCQEGASEFLRVGRYLGEDAAEGTLLTRREFEDLISSGDALAFRLPPSARPDGVLMVLRQSFGGDRGMFEQELLRSDPSMHREQGAEDSRAYVVHRQVALALRAVWGRNSYNDAWRAARREVWAEAQRLAERTFVLQGMAPENVALMALAFEGAGDKERSEVVLEMARRSRGDEFYQGACRHLEKLRRDLGQAARRAVGSPSRPR